MNEVSLTQTEDCLNDPLLIFSTLIIFLLSRYFRIKSRYTTQETADSKSRDETDSEIQDRFVYRLASLIRIPTVSWTEREKRDCRVYKQFQEELIRLFPLAHKNMEREVHGDFGLLYHWKGRDPHKKRFFSWPITM